MARGCVREGFSPAEGTSSLRYAGSSLATLPSNPLSSEQKILRAHHRPRPLSGAGAASPRFSYRGTPPNQKNRQLFESHVVRARERREDMTDSPYIPHRPTRRRLLDTAGVLPALEHHQRWSRSGLRGLAAGRHRPIDARGGRSPPSCQPPPSCSRGAWGDAGSALLLPPPAHRPHPPPEKAGKGAKPTPRFVPPARRSRAQPIP